MLQSNFVRAIIGIVVIATLLGAIRLFQASEKEVSADVYASIDSEHAKTTPPAPQFQVTNGSQQVGRDSEVPGEVRFSDGEVFQVNFRSMPASSIGYPANMANKYDEWTNAAIEGDAEIARMLSKSLDRCFTQPYKTEAEFDEAINQFQQTHQIPAVIQGQEVNLSADPTDKMIQVLKQEFEFCVGVSDKQVATSEQWLELASENGNVQAQLALGKKLMTTSPEGRKYLEMAWQSGNIDAASWLAKSLFEGTETLPSDPVIAYAYQAIYAELVKADYEIRGRSQDAFSQSWMQADAKGLAKMGNTLGPSELITAQELSKKLFEDNPNCCFSR